MKYYVLYQEYSEYNQFEGEWITAYETFSSMNAAKKYITFLKKNNNYRRIIGPLIHTCNLKNINSDVNW